jgi:2'-5' RNA ligase
MFVALRPDPGAVADLAAFVDVRRDADPELRWGLAEQWHVTLAFLPEVDERRLDDLVERVGRAAGRRRAFDLAVAGGTAFPEVARGRVLVAGLDVEAPLELDRLAAGVRAAGNRAGAAPDGGRFRPHLTLARARRPHDLTRWVRVLASYRGPSWRVDEVHLVASTLGGGPGGRPRHEVLASVSLAPTSR